MSKFLKFKPVLTMDEAGALLTRLTGESVDLETFRELWENCYLTPILCHGSRIVGFDDEAAEGIFSGGKAAPHAESRIGIVSSKFCEFDGVEGCIVDGTNGESLFFFIDHDYGQKTGRLKKEFGSEDLKPIAHDDYETFFYSYEEVRRLAELANDDAKLPSPPVIQPVRVRFAKQDWVFNWPLAEELLGLQTESGSFSMSASAVDALNRGGIQKKPFHPSERRSTGQIIATLAAMAGIDLSTPYAADEVLRAAAATHGLELPSSTETVVKFLKGAASRTGKA